MCGIIGVLGQEEAVPRLIRALKRLEYRGYDSAGVATLHDGHLERRRAHGKITNLEAKLAMEPLAGSVGIGHTRWATHGAPTTMNAHPHISEGVVVVHNGIIENFASLRERLEGEGHVFETETDTETIAHLISSFLKAGNTPEDSVRLSLASLEGAFAIAVLFEGHPDLMIGGRKGSPLVVGLGDGENFLGSDALAVAPFTDRVIYLEEGDWCILTRDSCKVFDYNSREVTREETTVKAEDGEADKGTYAHYMLKEIHEQPVSTARTVRGYTDLIRQEIELPHASERKLDFPEVSSVHMVSCGTAHYSTRVAEYWFEQLAGLPVKTDIASEFRYRKPVLHPSSLAIFVSQSGETADTLAALRYCKAGGLTTAAVVNVPTSTIAREADVLLPTFAGPEIGVASTKAFTAQLCSLAAVAIAAGRARKRLSPNDEHRLTQALIEVPRLIGETLELLEGMDEIAQRIHTAQDIIYLGRGVHYPLALEGALKLKEISYIHAEGFASGELKHGPIALVSEDTPIVFVAPFDDLFDKSLSNLQEVAARKGPVILITNERGAREAGSTPVSKIIVPDCDAFVAPILYSIPLQLLAYKIAVLRGTDVDQPRNLAKSVTVE